MTIQYTAKCPSLFKLTCNNISNNMLDWCRNQQSSKDTNNQLTLIIATPPPQPLLNRDGHPPKFKTTAGQTNKIHFENRKGIKIHFNQPFKINKEVQTVSFECKKSLKDGFSQTDDPPIPIIHLNSRRSSLRASRQASPTYKKHSHLEVKREVHKSNLANTLQVSKLTVDYKNSFNRETKASYIVQSQDQPHFYHNFKGVQSYHLPQNNCPQTVRIMNSKLPHKEFQQSQKMMESIKNAINEDHEENTFSERYHYAMRNVESEFKLPSQGCSEKKFKNTPSKRILFNERETIVSKYGDELHEESRSLRVEESLVYDREIKSLFTSIGKLEAYTSFIIFLAMENSIHIIVSIKEVSIVYMSDISQELLIYRALEEKRLKTEGVLELYQTQIDRETYIFIKEPFIASLRSYCLSNQVDINEILKKIQIILRQMKTQRFTLGVHAKMEDFVVCYDKIKVQNAGIFQFESIQKIEIEDALLTLKQEILQFLL